VQQAAARSRSKCVKLTTCCSDEAVRHCGRFVNLFDSELCVRQEIQLVPGSRFLLLDLESARGRQPQVLASACKVVPVKESADELSVAVEGVANTVASFFCTRLGRLALSACPAEPWSDISIPRAKICSGSGSPMRPGRRNYASFSHDKRHVTCYFIVVLSCAGRLSSAVGPADGSVQHPKRSRKLPGRRFRSGPELTEPGERLIVSIRKRIWNRRTRRGANKDKVGWF
jgi:hypothetical protein